MGLLYFSLLEVADGGSGEQSTGRLVRIPNGIVIDHAIVNYTQPFPYIWAELPLILSFESNHDLAEAILVEIANTQTEPVVAGELVLIERLRQRNILFSRLTPTVYRQLHQNKPAGVQLTLRFLCHPRQQRELADRMLRAILSRFAGCPDITLVREG